MGHTCVTWEYTELLYANNVMRGSERDMVGVEDILTHSVWHRDRNTSCTDPSTDPSTDSKAARDDEGEALVESSVANSAENYEDLLKKINLLSEFKKLMHTYFLI